MRKMILALIALATLTTAQPVHQTVWVKDDGVTPIAVLPFESESGAITRDEPWKIIAKDFEFSDKVEIHRLKEADSTRFVERNIALYVTGKYSVVGDSIKLEVTLNDITTGEQLLGKLYPITAKSLRDVSHRFANSVMEFIYNEKGPFETKVLYTRRTANGKDIYMMDYDGQRTRRVSKGGINIMPTFVTPDSCLWVNFQRGKPDIYRGNLRTGVMKPIIYSRSIEASPDYTPIRGRIAYSSTRSGNSEIYTADLNGKNREKLTVSPGIDASPAWSPNGFYIAFVSDRSGSPQIYVMDYTGSNERRLTFNGSYHDAPAWSPDGKKVVYTAQRNGKFDIFTINLDGTEETKISNVLPGSNQYPAWSPDGSHILFVNTRGKTSNLYRISADGSGEAVRVTTTGDVEMPAWSFID